MNHEKLICYQELLGATKEMIEYANDWPRGYASLVDQLKRAEISAVLNLSEGNGKRGNPRERRRFFRISQGSISEVSACIDLASVFSLIDKSRAKDIKSIFKACYNRIGRLP